MSISQPGQNAPIPYTSRREDAWIDSFLASKRCNRSILLVEGARQVGKTRFVQEAIRRSSRKSHEINLDRDSVMRSRIDECEDFWGFQDLLVDRIGFEPDAGEILFFDEAQESLRLGAFVRYMKEEWRNALVVLSGSTLTRLFREGTRYPVGRVHTLVMAPFSFGESLRARKEARMAGAIGSRPMSTGRHRMLLEHYDRYLSVGGMPGVVHATVTAEEAAAALGQLVADYEMDFLRLFGESDFALARGCLVSVANLAGHPSKNTAVVASPSTGTNARINEIFSRLERWHLVIRADQKGPSPSSSQKYLPKRYLFDTGVLRSLREVAVPALSVLRTLASDVRIPLGGILENQAAIEIKRSGWEVAGWKKSSSGTEIDFVIRDGDRTIPVECKASLDVDRRRMRGLLDYLELYGLSTGLLVSFAPYAEIEFGGGKRIINLPAYALDELATVMRGDRPPARARA